MKRIHFIRLLAVLLLCVTSAMLVPASALNSDEPVTIYEYEEFDLESLPLFFGNAEPDFSTSCSYRDQLSTDYAERVYDAFIGMTPEDNEYTEQESYLNQERYTQAEYNSIKAWASSQIKYAFVAAIMDHPELFWANSVGLNYLRTSHTDGTLSNIRITASIKPAEDYDTSLYASQKAQLDNYVNSFAFTGSNQYEKIKTIHDALCNQLEYDLKGSYAHSVYAIIDGKSVCEGYAKTFKLLCNKANIPCMVITGMAYQKKNSSTVSEAHAWNAVRMEDGKWYGLDATWDDQGDKGIFTDFFLVGSQTIATHFSGNFPFATSHVADGDYYGDGSSIVQYPTLSETAYEPTTFDPVYDADGDGALTAADGTAIMQYLGGLKNAPTGFNCDLNNDGNFDVYDCVLMMQQLAK